MENIIDLQTSILLNKLGAGGHKPGSGSAVALQGMIAAQMIRTVTDLTKERSSYKSIHKDLDIVTKEIEEVIYPALTDLIQKDAVQFGKAIEARKARDAAKNITEKSAFAEIALQELKIATEIPITIAKYCIRLTEMGIYIFDHCFQSARGDSSVAINGALSAVSGCLAIVNLNLLSFGSNKWTISMRSEADDIKESRDRLLVQENERQTTLQNEADQMHKFHLEIEEFKKKLNNVGTVEQIEQLVSNIQNSMWRYRDAVWKKNVPQQPAEIIDPVKLLKKLGYQYEEVDSLDTYSNKDGDYEIAGIIDSEKKHVIISTSFSPTTINFTVAHELGHALLHPNQTLHRDRPMDGSGSHAFNDYKEIQANKFASCFLMPRKLLKQQFMTLFLTDKFEINTLTALRFGFRIDDFRRQCKSMRELARLLAAADFYNNRRFYSLSEQFQVSTETMAIRLEELKLVSF